MEKLGGSMNNGIILILLSQNKFIHEGKSMTQSGEYS